MLQKPYQKYRSSELTPVEAVIIANIYLLLKRTEDLVTEIQNEANGDSRKVIAAAQELSFLKRHDSLLENLRKQLYEWGSVPTLNKIIKGEKFLPEYQWGEPFTISQEVLPKFRSYDEVKVTDPKAAIAKDLGAKLVA